MFALLSLRKYSGMIGLNSKISMTRRLRKPSHLTIICQYYRSFNVVAVSAGEIVYVVVA